MTEDAHDSSAQESSPFLSASFPARGGIYIHLDTDQLNGYTTEWMGYVLASMARGISKVLIRTNDLPEGMLEQVETEISNAFADEMRSGNGDQMDVRPES